jgi:prolipoprotein diacylglyceryl transferase
VTVPAPLGAIPSPSFNALHLGRFQIRLYGMMIALGVLAAVTLAGRRWERRGGDPSDIPTLAAWAVPAGLVGARAYHVITDPELFRGQWYRAFYIWEGGLGIWGGIALGVAVGLWVAKRRGLPLLPMLDCVAPALALAQAIGRWGNYWNQELFGRPTTLPWGLEIDPAHRPPGYEHYATFQPTFLYEIVWNLSLAAVLIWLGRTRRIRAPGLFALYVAGYSAFRIFEETLRIDYSNHFLGLRVNFYVAGVLCLGAVLWFIAIQRGWRLRRAAGMLGLAWIVAWAAGCGSMPAVGADQSRDSHRGGLQLVGGEAWLEPGAAAQGIQRDHVMVALVPARRARTLVTEGAEAVASGNDLPRHAAGT